MFLFSADEAKKMSDAEPEKYRIAYHGWCATGLAMGKKIASNPEVFTVHKGTTYLFLSTEAQAAARTGAVAWLPPGSKSAICEETDSSLPGDPIGSR